MKNISYGSKNGFLKRRTKMANRLAAFFFNIDFMCERQCSDGGETIKYKWRDIKKICGNKIDGSVRQWI